MAPRWLGGFVLLLLNCSVLYGDPPLGQCASDADCVNELGLAGTHCDLEHAVCVEPLASKERSDTEAPLSPSGTEPPPSCPAGSSASALSSRECPCSEGAIDDPNALVIGTIAPHTFRTSSGEPLQIPYVPRWLQTIGLGLAEWQREAPGGRLYRTERPLALLHCNSNDDLPQARRAMAHLFDAAHAPVVLTLTDNDTNAVRYQATRQGTTLICATCFAAAPDDPAESRLVWTIAPPLVTQAPLAAWRVGELANALRRERAIAAPTSIDVVVLSQEYPGIDAYVTQVDALLRSSGGYRLIFVQTPDPRLESVLQLDVARAVVAARPQVIIVGMDTDFTTYYLRMIESEWPSEAPPPHYVLTHMNQELGLLADIVADDDSLRQRLAGTGFGLDEDVALNLAGLEQRFAARYSARLDNTQYGYDAFYAALYALMLTDRARTLNGDELSTSLALLRAGAATSVGPQALRSSLGYLMSYETLDLVGTSSRLDWHATTHQTQSDVVLWCLTRDASGALLLQSNAGPRWRHDTGEISGDYVCL